MVFNKNKKPPVKEAVALEYDPKRGAPVIIASGSGAVAENIINKAKEHDIAIYEDPDLSRVLNLMKIGDEIPPELYNVVAQILVYVGNMDKKIGGAK